MENGLVQGWRTCSLPSHKVQSSVNEYGMIYYKIHVNREDFKNCFIKLKAATTRINITEPIFIFNNACIFNVYIIMS